MVWLWNELWKNLNRKSDAVIEIERKKCGDQTVRDKVTECWRSRLSHDSSGIKPTRDFPYSLQPVLYILVNPTHNKQGLRITAHNPKRYEHKSQFISTSTFTPPWTGRRRAITASSIPISCYQCIANCLSTPALLLSWTGAAGSNLLRFGHWKKGGRFPQGSQPIFQDTRSAYTKHSILA